MRRDPELVRNILLAIEAQDNPNDGIVLAFDGVSDAQISYHVKLLAQAGYIEAIDFSGHGMSDWQPSALTWQGHEFLDAARDQTIWRGALAQAGKAANSVSFTLLLQLLNYLGKVALGLP